MWHDIFEVLSQFVDKIDWNPKKGAAKDWEFTTESMKGLLKGNDFSVDSDGDILQKMESSGQVPFDWFIWYYPHGSYLVIDSGEKGLPRNIDPRSLVRRVIVKSSLINVVVNDDNRIRIRARVEAEYYNTVGALGQAMIGAIEELSSIWHQIADNAGMFRVVERVSVCSDSAASSYRSSSSSGSSSGASSSGSSTPVGPDKKTLSEIHTIESEIEWR